MTWSESVRKALTPDDVSWEDTLRTLKAQVAKESFDDRVRAYNAMVAAAAELVGLPHPVLAPQLVPIESVVGNTYNPNRVATPEMRLLEFSIRKDGLTMPVVVAKDPEDGKRVVVDGFHRTTVVKTCSDIRDSLAGYLPVTSLDRSIEDRITSTVRHNMARGSHQVELTAKLVIALKKNNWSNERIGAELGMDPDEVLRLRQVTGLAEAFADQEFSKAWE